MTCTQCGCSTSHTGSLCSNCCLALFGWPYDAQYKAQLLRQEMRNDHGARFDDASYSPA